MCVLYENCSYWGGHVNLSLRSSSPVLEKEGPLNTMVSQEADFWVMQGWFQIDRLIVGIQGLY